MRRTRWTCASTPAGASSTTFACCRPTAPALNASPATWRPGAAPGRPSPAACARSPGFYKYAAEEDLLEHSPAAHVRRPRLDYESCAVGLDRNELGALLVAAGLGQPAEHALISLLALNGLRVSEATGANIEALGVERGHRTLVINCRGRQGRHHPTRAARRPGDRLGRGRPQRRPLFLAADGRRLDRHGAARIVRRVACRAESPSWSGRTLCGTRSSRWPWTPGCRGGMCRKLLRTLTPAPL